MLRRIGKAEIPFLLQQFIYVFLYPVDSLGLLYEEILGVQIAVLNQHFDPNAHVILSLLIPPQNERRYLLAGFSALPYY